MKEKLCPLVFSLCSCILGVFPSNIEGKESDLQVPGEHLLLTPLLEKGDYKTAQQLSRVKPDLGNITSFSGFLTVNEKCGSNVFFWFFPAESTEWKDAPLVLTVSGGLASPSSPTIFQANGPFRITDSGLEKREFSWNRDNNLLFFDQIGTGYSYTEKNCFPEDGSAVGEDLYQAVVQIHKLFPELQGNKFIMAGEAYAGHFISYLGHAIHKKNPTAEIKINLSAMMIGNGWMDTALQSDFGDFLYQHGLLDTAGKGEYDHYYSECKTHIQAENWTEAYRYCPTLVSNLYYNKVGGVNLYNYAKPYNNESGYRSKYLESPKMRQALHLGNVTFQKSDPTYKLLELESVKSVKHLVEELLEDYPMVFYNGQLTLLTGYPMMVNFLRSLTWSGRDKYLSADRTKWCMPKGSQVGFFSGSHHLFDVMVLDAGYWLSWDQPELVLQLLSSVTSGTKNNPLHGLADCGIQNLKVV